VLETINDTYEIIFINDGSTDDSLAIIKKLSSQHSTIKYISFTRNFGHQNALLAGIRHSVGEYLITMDSDLQDPPRLIPDLIALSKQGYEVVNATRKYNQPDGVTKKYFAKIFYWIYNQITEVPIPHASGDFRLFSRQVADEILKMGDSHYFIRGQIAWLNFNTAAIYFEREKRGKGEISYTTSRSLKLAIDAIFTYSNFPLKIVTFLGLATAIVSGIMILITLIKIFLLNYDMVQGWSSLLLSVLFIGGVQMIAIGIIGEYLIRITDQVRNRPGYIIAEKKLEKP
jgi:dolichol-phosphate mannosyltransferase